MENVPDKTFVSEEVVPDREGNKKLDFILQEHYALKSAIHLWNGPKYPDYCSLPQRIRSFENSNWSYTYPTPVELAEAGFFLDRKFTTF